MSKRITSIFVLIALCMSLFSCAPGKKSVFKTAANEYFEQYKTAFGNSERTYEFSNVGSVAMIKIKTKSDTLDAQLEVFYEKLRTDFFGKSKTYEDTLFSASKAYKAADGVIGVEVYTKETVSGAVTENVYTFNTDMPKSLITMSVNSAKAKIMSEHKSDVDIYALKKSENVKLVYTDSGVSVMYKAGDIMPEELGDVRVDVSYSELYATLPDTLKEKTEKPKRVIDPDGKMVALTFDDGPHAVYTPKLLDVLEENNSVATFFEVGNLISNGVESINRAKDMGCEIASHTWSHANLKTSSKDKINDQIKKADTAIEEVTGETPSLLRPPYGAVGSDLRENSDKYLIGWSVDTLDWRSRDAHKVINVVKSEGDLDGDVILMHSLYQSTVDAVEYLVPWLIENGYQLVTVSELVTYKYNDILEPGKYYSAGYFKGDAKQ